MTFDPLKEKAEQAVQRAVKLQHAWPKLGPDQGVKANYVLRALQLIRPAAEKVAALPIGTTKGTIQGSGVFDTVLRTAFPAFLVVESLEGAAQPGTGYLSGSPLITAADHAVAADTLAVMDRLLPALGENVLDRGQYEIIREKAWRLLAVATDLEIDCTAFDQMSLFWASVKESVQDLKKATEKGLGVLGILAVVVGTVYVAKTLFGKG